MKKLKELLETKGFKYSVIAEKMIIGRRKDRIKVRLISTNKGFDLKLSNFIFKSTFKAQDLSFKELEFFLDRLDTSTLKRADVSE